MDVVQKSLHSDSGLSRPSEAVSTLSKDEASSPHFHIRWQNLTAALPPELQPLLLVTTSDAQKMEILRKMTNKERTDLMNSLTEQQKADLCAIVGPRIRVALIRETPPAERRDIFSAFKRQDQVALLSSLPMSARHAILSVLPADERLELNRLLMEAPVSTYDILVQNITAQKAKISFLRHELEQSEDELRELRQELSRYTFHTELDSELSVSGMFTDDDKSSEMADSTRSPSGRARSDSEVGLPRSKSSLQLHMQHTDLVDHMRHPMLGVPVGRHTYHLRTHHNVFTGADAVTWLLEHTGVTTRDDALSVGKELFNHGYVFNVPGGSSFQDSKSKLYRFKAFIPANLPLLPKTILPPEESLLVESRLRLLDAVHNNGVLQWLKLTTHEILRRMYPAVLMYGKLHTDQLPEITRHMIKLARDHPSLKTAYIGYQNAHGDCACPKTIDLCEDRGSMRLSSEEELLLTIVQARPSRVVSKLMTRPNHQIVHPFVSDRTCHVELVKEFNSAAKPSLLRFVDVDTKEEVEPKVIAKLGDDLRKDLAVQQIFFAFDAIFSAADVVWRLGAPPSVKTYQVLIAGLTSGFIEFVPGAVVKDVAMKGEWSSVNLAKLAPSIVGSMVSGFVLGVRDRHSENWMLVGDRTEDPQLMQIDFGYMLMENPGGFPLDTPRLTLQPSLIKLLKNTRGSRASSSKPSASNSLLDDLRADLITAYTLLRKHQHTIISFAKTALAAVYPPDDVDKFMRGRHSFHTDETEEHAVQWFAEKVHSQLTRFNMRRTAKHALVSGFYAFQKVNPF